MISAALSRFTFFFLTSRFFFVEFPLLAGVIFITKAKKNPKLIFNDYEYHYRRTTRDGATTQWRCARKKCFSRLHVSGTILTASYRNHNHASNLKNESTDCLISQNVYVKVAPKPIIP